jgi:hypothetical protein
LQRQRLAESRDYGELSRAVFDQRARRLLHDEVLPLLHTAMLTLSGSQPQANHAGDDPVSLMGDAHRQISNLLREMPVVAAPEIDRLGLVGALQETVAGEMNGVFDEGMRRPKEKHGRWLLWLPKSCSTQRERPCATLPTTVVTGQANAPCACAWAWPGANLRGVRVREDWKSWSKTMA